MSKKPENPLANIFINVLIPVMALSFLSKDPVIQAKLGNAVRPWHLGPLKALVIALALPLGYGVWFFIKNRKGNFFSMLGLFSVMLTGGLTLYLWNEDGSVKSSAAFLYGVKEASIPLILGFAILASHRTANPLLRVFLYNDTIFDIPKIESKIDDEPKREVYGSLLLRATCLFSTSFAISATINLCLTLFMFRGFEHSAGNALETYNGIIGKITGWSFAVVLVPAVGFLYFTLQRLINGLKSLTGLPEEEILMPR